jgi:membrane-bound serine protease (ClpP class)
LMTNGGLIDEIGEARTALAPGGKVFVHGEYWDAVSATPVNKGEPVRVVTVDGMKLRVEPRVHP